MPRRFFCILLLCALLCFAGCTPQLPAASTHATTETVSAAVSFQDEPVCLSAISLPVVQEAEQAPDGTEIFLHTYQNVALVLPNPEIADAITLDLLNRMDRSADAQDILAQATLAYTPSNTWQSYICRNIFTPTRLDNHILSFFSTLTTFQGNAHPEGAYSSVSYDLTTGNVLELHNILLPHFDMQLLTDEIKAALQAQEIENYLYSYYRHVVDERFAEDVLDDKNWYFSQTGLCFYFAPYEIAPYSSGVIVAEVPYEKLTGILENAYFPEEISETEGTMIQEPFDTSAQTQYESFWEIALEDGSEKRLLHPDNTLYNVRLELANPEGEFTPECTLFSASALSPKDAVVITYKDASSLSGLRISYTIGGKTVCQSIS